MIGELEAFVAEEFRFHIYLDNANELLDGGKFLVHYMIRKTYKEGFFSREEVHPSIENCSLN